MRRVMWERAGLIRSEERLSDGLKEVDALQREIEGDSAVAARRLRRAQLAAEAATTEETQRRRLIFARHNSIEPGVDDAGDQRDKHSPY